MCAVNETAPSGRNCGGCLRLAVWQLRLIGAWSGVVGFSARLEAGPFPSDEALGLPLRAIQTPGSA